MTLSNPIRPIGSPYSSKHRYSLGHLFSLILAVAVVHLAPFFLHFDPQLRAQDTSNASEEIPGGQAEPDSDDAQEKPDDESESPGGKGPSPSGVSSELAAAWAGVWKNVKGANSSLAEFEIQRADDGTLRVRFGQPGSRQPFAKPLPLRLLKQAGGDRYVGLAKLDGKTSQMLYQVLGDGDSMTVRVMRMFNDTAKLGVFVESDFTRSGQPVAPETRTSAAMTDGPADEDTGSEKDDDDSDEPAYRGLLIGQVASGSTMRGLLTLSPLADGTRPQEPIAVGGSNPSFRFENVPNGEYTLTFEGTIRGSRSTLKWEKLKPADPDTTATPLRLTIGG